MAGVVVQISEGLATTQAMLRRVHEPGEVGDVEYEVGAAAKLGLLYRVEPCTMTLTAAVNAGLVRVTDDGEITQYRQPAPK